MERVTQAEAARTLGMHKSTVTRWVQKHPALLDDAGLVSIDDLRRHRDETVNPKLITRGLQLGQALDAHRCVNRHGAASGVWWAHSVQASSSHCWRPSSAMLRQTTTSPWRLLM